MYTNIIKRHKPNDFRTFGNATSKVASCFSNTNEFSRYLLQQGKLFETMIVELLRQNHPVQFVSDKINPETVALSRHYIEQKLPILHSVPIINEANNTKGIIDLLVRSDYLDKIFRNPPKHDVKEFTYYVVIDVKFSSLKLKSDDVHVLNCKKLRAYKYQLLIYNEAIGKLQNFTPRYSYLIGRRVKSGGDVFINSFHQAGVIDFEGTDEFIKTYYDNQDSEQYTTDIKDVWNCTSKHEKLAIKKNVFSWKNPRFNSELIEETGNKGKIIDAILHTNRQDEHKVLPLTIRNNIYNWKNKETECYIDFETFCDVCKMNDYTNQVFMIGIWFNDAYYNFTSESTTDEKELCDKLFNFLEENRITKVWYYYADKMIMNKMLKRCERSTQTHIEWCDLLVLFKNPDEPITIKNCFRFGLKEVAKTLHEHGLIQTKLESDCVSGLDAGLKCYMELSKSKDERNESILEDVKKYNEFDVKILHEILTYLRNNHVNKCSE